MHIHAALCVDVRNKRVSLQSMLMVFGSASAVCAGYGVGNKVSGALQIYSSAFAHVTCARPVVHVANRRLNVSSGHGVITSRCNYLWSSDHWSKTSAARLPCWHGDC